MGPDGPSYVAALGWVFNFDDLRAKIPQQHAAERSSAVLFHGDDAHAGERKHPSLPC